MIIIFKAAATSPFSLSGQPSSSLILESGDRVPFFVFFCWRLLDLSFRLERLFPGNLVRVEQAFLLKLWNVKFEEVSHEMFVLMLISSRTAGFLMPSQCLWGKLQNLSLVEGFKTGCNVVLRGRLGTSWHFNMLHDVTKVVLCGTHNTFATFSEDALQFSWQAQRFRCVVFPVFFANRTVRAASSNDTQHSAIHSPHFTLLHSTLCTLRSTLYTPHVTLYTPHFTPHTLHSRLHTPHFTLHTLHFLFHTPHFTFHTPHFTLYTPHLTLSTLHFPLHTLHLRLNTWNSTLYIPNSTLYPPHSTLHTFHFPLHALHFTLYTLDFTLHTSHFTLYTSHFYTVHCRLLFALYTLHSPLCTPPFALNTPHFTLHT